jgi:hypothetical protein
MPNPNEKAQVDRSNGNYDPPSRPGLFSSSDTRDKYYEEKEVYDKSWEVTKAQQDQSDGDYKPPPKPGWDDGDYSSEKKWNERDAYDKSWDDSKDNSDDQAEESSSGGCFITSACVESKGLTDNCYELETLRNFRDTYMFGIEDGEKLIKNYYEFAPKVVKSIDGNESKSSIYNWLYDELVLRSINFIEAGDNDSAFKNYKSVFEYLRYNFI